MLDVDTRAQVRATAMVLPGRNAARAGGGCDGDLRARWYAPHADEVVLLEPHEAHKDMAPIPNASAAPEPRPRLTASSGGAVYGRFALRRSDGLRAFPDVMTQAQPAIRSPLPKAIAAAWSLASSPGSSVTKDVSEHRCRALRSRRRAGCGAHDGGRVFMQRVQTPPGSDRRFLELRYAGTAARRSVCSIEVRLDASRCSARGDRGDLGDVLFVTSHGGRFAISVPRSPQARSATVIAALAT
jgi:hypothetical protein